MKVETKERGRAKVSRPSAFNQSGGLVVRGLVVLVILAIGVTFAYRYFWLSTVSDNPKFTTLERSLQDIRAAMNIDSVRQYNIQKIMKIISQYNKDMPSGLRYEIADEIYSMSVKYTNLDVDLICATITHESGATWDPEVVSEAGAMGLMQMMPTMGMWIAHYEGITWTSAEDVLFNPIYNIRIGSRCLSALIAAYGLEGGLAAYSAGERRAATWLANHKSDELLWAETNNYIPHIMKFYNEYKTMTL